MKIKNETTEQLPETADLEQVKALSDISKFDIAGIPVGSAALGGGIAFLVDTLTERFLPQVTGPTANLLGAFAIVYLGKRFLGSGTANAASMFLTYEALRDTIEGALGGLFPAQQAQQRQPAMRQQPAVTSSYYGAMV
jgi:hypothetical protein